ncbi:hypothetical protein [Bacillus sp. CECT 9360]|uniref:hypothetical protein n=1 Tax=Bacillus sp. CECT 9360 TaxID=2845821 RepID=UPI001E39BEC9|nr:hypothetical protein [Bacillus sp. CECT 9360]CAH0344622.1 hypothetical protein BCI9360_00882 [Bacillus sp. CECT 9360]
MCYIITIGLDKEISEQVIDNLELKNILIERVSEGNSIHIFSGKYSYVYTVTNGMCSCDFFKKTSNNKKMSQYLPFLASLFRLLISEGYSLSFHFHMYTDVYGVENLPILKKVKIDGESFVSKLANLEEDIVYVTNKYI